MLNDTISDNMNYYPRGYTTDRARAYYAASLMSEEMQNRTKFGHVKYARGAFNQKISDYEDVNYLDVAWQQHIPEDGELPTRSLVQIGVGAGSGVDRQTNKIIVRRIECRGEMVLETGNKVVGRLILVRDKQPQLEDWSNILDPQHLPAHKRVKELRVKDILASSPITLLENVVEGDAPDLEEKPNSFCFNKFINTKSQYSDRIVHLWDQYIELQTQCFSLEDTTAVPTARYFTFTLNDLYIPVNYENEYYDSCNMNNITFMWIGDYSGGVLLGTIFFRIYYDDVSPHLNYINYPGNQ